MSSPSTWQPAGRRWSPSASGERQSPPWSPRGTTRRPDSPPPEGAEAEAPTGPPPAVPMVIGAIGLVLVALSLFLLDWAGTDSFGDVRRRYGEASGLRWPDSLAGLYARWLGYAVAASAVTAAIAVVVGRIGGSARHVGHVAAAVVAGGGAVLHTFFVVRTFRGDDVAADIGAWLATAGYLVIVLALVLSARRRPVT